MHVLPPSGPQALTQNRIHELQGRSVIQKFRRIGGRQVDGNGMSRAGANLLAVRTERKTLLVVFGDGG
jgi:hypothetical protein